MGHSRSIDAPDSGSGEATIFPTLRELGIATTAYGVLSRGLLVGSKPTGPRDFRAHLPRFAAQLADTLAALELTLDAREVAALEEAVPAAAVLGTRYAAPQMQHLDSER